MAKGKNQLERIFEIDRKLRSGLYPSKKVFTEQFEVSNKSIERDLEFMRERLGAPLCYSTEHRGYYYSETSYFLPGNMMNEAELFALLMSQQLIDSIGDSPIKDSLLESCRNLSRFLPAHQKNEIDLSISRFTIISEPSVVIKSNIWQIILFSLRENRQLMFEYKKSAQGNDYRDRELFPYHIVSWRGSWYVIGQNPEKDKIETYCISRMKSLKPGKIFSYPSEFDINRYIEKGFGLYNDSETKYVSIRFDKWCAPYIRERIWHRAQKIEENKDGSLIMGFQTNQIETTRQWILRWGSGAVVLEPPELVDAIRETIKELAGHYNLIQ